MGQGESGTRLVVFSDDWGRHPSSCQHLIRHLLPRYPTLWVNTIGTRPPRLSWEDAGKAWHKLRSWMGRGPGPATALPGNLRTLAPRMYPGFRRHWQRRLNARLISRAVAAAWPPDPARRTVILTTLPITADLVGRLPADRWVYYCVDDFSVWPGMDGDVMQAMEGQQVLQVQACIAASQMLRQRLAALGTTASLLTHGIDLEHWGLAAAPPSPAAKAAQPAEPNTLPGWCRGLSRPILLFWGLIDARLDVAWCRAVLERGVGTLVLVGPQQAPPAELAALAQRSAGRLVLPGPAPYEVLPVLARWADALIMPYADLSVTRAMQPLKFKEYLAAGWPEQFRPVIARALPATQEWADAADLVTGADEFVAALRRRVAQGVPEGQRQARQRLAGESWAAKARELEAVINR